MISYYYNTTDNDAVNAAAAIAFSSSMHECLSNSQIKKRLSEEVFSVSFYFGYIYKGYRRGSCRIQFTQFIHK